MYNNILIQHYTIKRTTLRGLIRPYTDINRPLENHFEYVHGYPIEIIENHDHFLKRIDPKRHNRRFKGLELSQRGWGNGYVGLPKGHPLFGMGYYDIHDKYPDLQIHGGLTYANRNNGFWVIGFDTGHAYDNIETWSREAVWKETVNLARQISEISE